jgi:NAD(P)-dependent dehydrogenase (short-subunit alcohol dehydrogenase family)
VAALRVAVVRPGLGLIGHVHIGCTPCRLASEALICKGEIQDIRKGRHMPVSVVTGAAGGIGRWIAFGLANAGHTVILVGRNRERAQEAASWITGRNPAAQIEVVIADLSSLAETRSIAALIRQLHPAVNVLVNNAGTFCTRREETLEGHERVIALNHLSPFVLTSRLMPALREAAADGQGARIVNVGSSTSDRARINPLDLEGRFGWGMVRSYSQSKLAFMMATFGWAYRLKGTGITANVVHPGAVATQLVRAKGPIGLAWRAMAPFLLTEEAGANTPLFVALAPNFQTVTGNYLKKRQIARPNPRALNAALLEEVWRATERLAGEWPDV